MSKFARRVDANQSEIVQALERMGVATVDLSQAAQFRAGLPDLLCSLHGYTFLAECKTDLGELSPEQLHFMEEWKGPVYVLRTTDDVVARVTEIRKMTGAGRFVKHT